MQAPTTAQSSDVLVRLGTYLYARLAAGPATRALVATVQTRTDEVARTALARQEKARALVVAEAGADAAEEALELPVKTFGDALYNACGRDRRAPRFRAVAPDGFAVLTQPRRQDQVDAAERLLRRLESLPDEPLVPEHRPKVEAGVTALKEALAPVATAAAELERARTAEYLARAAFVATYVSTYGALVATLGSKAAAERYFLRFRAEAPTVEPEPPADSEPANA